MEFSIQFDKAQLDYVVNVLAQRPYQEVAVILQHIGQQVQQQSQGQAAGLPAAKANGAAAETSVQ